MIAGSGCADVGPAAGLDAACRPHAAECAGASGNAKKAEAAAKRLFLMGLFGNLSNPEAVIRIGGIFAGFVCFARRRAALSAALCQRPSRS